jgi:hypothetical protein
MPPKPALHNSFLPLPTQRSSIPNGHTFKLKLCTRNQSQATPHALFPTIRDHQIRDAPNNPQALWLYAPAGSQSCGTYLERRRGCVRQLQATKSDAANQFKSPETQNSGHAWT